MKWPALLKYPAGLNLPDIVKGGELRAILLLFSQCLGVYRLLYSCKQVRAGIRPSYAAAKKGKEPQPSKVKALDHLR